MTPCRIGSLPWFAGVWWLIVALVLQGFSRLALALRLHLVSLSLLILALRATRLATQCAVEGGAEL